MDMFQGTLSDLTPLGKLLLLIALVFSFLLFSTLVGIVILVPAFGTGILEILANPDFRDPKLVNYFKVMQILNMAGGILLPALIYAFMTHRRPMESLRIKTSTRLVPVVLSALLILVAQPLIGYTVKINSYLHLPEFLTSLENWMYQMEDQANVLTEAFLATTSTQGFMVNIFMIAILPAISEEILFRGILAQLFREWTRSIHWAVFLSSFIFAAIHMQFFGFLPRFLMGIAFGYLLFRTGSLWLPITAHFINNFFWVLTEYLFRNGIISVHAEDFGVSESIYWLAGSIILTGLVLHILLKDKKPLTT